MYLNLLKLDLSQSEVFSFTKIPNDLSFPSKHYKYCLLSFISGTISYSTFLPLETCEHERVEEEMKGIFKITPNIYMRKIMVFLCKLLEYLSNED